MQSTLAKITRMGGMDGLGADDAKLSRSPLRSLSLRLDLCQILPDVWTVRLQRYNSPSI